MWRCQVPGEGWQGWGESRLQIQQGQKKERGGEEQNEEVPLGGNTVYPWIQEGEGERACASQSLTVDTWIY